MQSILKIIAPALLWAGVAGQALAQSAEQAKTMFDEGRYAEAKPAYEQLVKQSPGNTTYNLRYGICCYETGDLDMAERYLTVANKRKSPESYRYLADIYTHTYRFGAAETMLRGQLAQLKRKRGADTSPIEEQLRALEKMQRMQEKTEQVHVIDSVVVDKNRLLSAYFLSDDNGRLVPYATLFPRATDALGASPVYVSPRGDRATYARIMDGHSALFSQSKLQNEWTDERPLFPTDSADNSYPFVAGDGVTLYFASRGHGSIGGYDLFVTRYNIASNTYLAPEQLGMPFNSPANDYLMVIDEAKGVGWFATDRNQPQGRVCLYLFIPNEARPRVSEDIDADSLRTLASLASIRATLPEGSSYDQLVAAARTNTAAVSKKEQDFEFVINDNTIYYTERDFRNADAAEAYEKAAMLRKQAEDVEKRLKEAYAAYEKGNKSERNELRASIRDDERTLDDLRTQIKTWEKRARNAENRTIIK